MARKLSKELTNKERKKILSLWHDPNFFGSYSGITNFNRALEKYGIKVSRPQLSALLYSIPSYIDKIRPVKIPHYRPYRYVASNICWEADIADMHPREDNGYRYYLVIVDIFSRKLFTFAMKNRKQHWLIRGFEHAYRENNNKWPEKVEGDNEIFLLKNWFKQHNVYVRRRFRRNKAGLSELYVYKTKRRIWAYLDSYSGPGNPHWTHMLQKFTKNMNETPDSVLGGKLSPSDIRDSRDDWKVWKANPERKRLIHFQTALKNQKEYEKSRRKSDFQVGDLVLYDHENPIKFRKAHLSKVRITISLYFNGAIFADVNTYASRSLEANYYPLLN